MSPRPATGTTPVTSNNTSEEDTVTKPTRTYTRNRIDYSLLFDGLTSQPGQRVTHEDLYVHLKSLGRGDEFPHYRKALNYLSRPVSLSIRLFANMMAGHTMLKVFAYFSIGLTSVLGGAVGWGLGILPVAINVALVGFEILVAFLQAYVFTILTCLYIRDALELH